MSTITGEYEYEEPTDDELFNQWIENMMWLDAQNVWERLGGKCPLCQEPMTVEDVFYATPCVCQMQNEVPF